jgi:glycerate kinase
LTRLADVIGGDARDVSGSGAAGGLGFGLISFCGAELRSGFDVVADAIQLAQKVQAADFVITGEGRLDDQTLEGKAPAGVAQLARKYGKPVFAVVGENGGGTAATALFDEVFPLVRSPVSCTLAMKMTGDLVRERAAELARSLRAR